MWSNINRCVLTIILIGSFQITRGAFLRCYKGSLKEFFVTSLNNPLPLVNSSCIDRSLPTVVYTFGYRGRVSGPATTAVMEAYLATRKRNVILLDWEEEAKSGIFGIPLGYALSAIPNAKKVGREMGEALVTLSEAGVNTTTVHLLGHSLGAHIMATAGRTARKNGHVVARITGLDPARAFFEGTLSVQEGLDRTCAKFVDIIHTDPGGYGTSSPAGTVDLWPNYAGKGSSQPGCPNGDFTMFSSEENITLSEYQEYYPDYDIARAKRLTKLQKIRMAMRPNLCNHDRSWRYFVEALSSPTSFQAAAMSDFGNWQSALGQNTKTIFMGDLINKRAHGNYFLATNSKTPYGRGMNGLKPDENLSVRKPRDSTLTRLLKYI